MVKAETNRGPEIEELGKYFEALREAANLSQGDVAKALGLGSGQYISNVERGKCIIAIGNLKKLAKLYGVTDKALRISIANALIRRTKRIYGLDEQASTKPRTASKSRD